MALEVSRNYTGTRLLSISTLAALVGFAGLGVGLVVARSATYFGYLTAFAFVASVALGALVFLLTTYVVGARWSVVLRRLNEAVVSVFPVLGLLFLPLAFGMDRLYLWAEPNPALHDAELALLHHKQRYLNGPGFLLRTALYFVIWCAAAMTLRAWSLARDRGGREPSRDHARERVFSAALLPLVALALTFASFDWLMSLEPFWSSTVFGVYYFSGGFVASFGLLALLAFGAHRSGLERLVRPAHFHALGRLMFGFTVFWAYIAFFQALLIRIANRPEEVAFYVRRLEKGWDVVAWLLILVRFVVPVFVLLPQAIKFRPRAMAVMGVWLVLGQYLDVFWLVQPVSHGHGPLPNIWDIAALLAVAGSASAFAAWRLRGDAIVPIGDPCLEQSIAYRSPL
jgi:hypothetical protein